MTDTAELIGRLKHAGNGNGAQPKGYYSICTEAATALEMLQAENELLKKEVRQLKDRASRLEFPDTTGQ